MSQQQLTIVLSGMIAGDPGQGGATWAVLQYLLGLRRLGHRVLFVEPITLGSQPPKEAYFEKVAGDFNFQHSAALLLAGTQQTFGLPYAELCQIAGQADLLINISGMLRDENLIKRIPKRVYLDLDPAFNQLWHAVQGIDMRFSGHTHFVTIGLNVGEPACPEPTCGLSWITTPQPVVLEHWPLANQIVHDGLTSVGNWRGYGSI